MTYYSGPWIENYFIDRFVNKPLQSFGGIFPLFVQWTDYLYHIEVNDVLSSCCSNILLENFRSGQPSLRRPRPRSPEGRHLLHGECLSEF